MKSDLRAALGFQQAIVNSVGFALAVYTIAHTVPVQQKPKLLVSFKRHPLHMGLTCARYQKWTLVHDQEQIAHHRLKATALF